jgi:hypothetical protein
VLRQTTDRYTFDYTPPMAVALQVPLRTAAAVRRAAERYSVLH